MEVQGEIIKLYRESSESAIINTNMPYFYAVFENSNSTENELLYAAAAFDDIFEFCSMPVLNLYFLFNFFSNRFWKKLFQAWYQSTWNYHKIKKMLISYKHLSLGSD